MSQSAWIRTGALLLAAAVALGAFGAHGLRTRLDAPMMAIYEKAVWYHTVHALGLLLVANLAAVNMLPDAAFQRVAFLLTGGVLFFSGSLYALALSGLKWLGMITPLGGAAFIAAWLILAFSAARN